jgi:hypothetical protein
MNSIKILIATQTRIIFEDKLANNYLPIEVGAGLKKNKIEIGYLKDNEGDNISTKNPNYCELTALYWAWKNLKSDIVGLSHYRRYFLFNYNFIFNTDKIPIYTVNSNFINSININNEEIIELLTKYDIILPKIKKLNKSIYDVYKEDSACFEKDLKITKEIIIKKYPDMINSVDFIFTKNSMYFYNMFLMKKHDFDSYMNWLFDILFEVEKKIDITDYNKVQARVFGFIAERLFNIYIYHNKFRIKEFPIAYFNPNHRIFKFFKISNLRLIELIYTTIQFITYKLKL